MKPPSVVDLFAAAVLVLVVFLVCTTDPFVVWAARPNKTNALAAATTKGHGTDTRVASASPAGGSKQRWRRPLREIPLQDTRDDGRYPPDLAAELTSRESALAPAPAAKFQSPRWSATVFQWAASELDHQPLYFDDVPLERYGQSPCPLLQPFFSAARFYGTVPIMPYKVGLDLPWECVSTLGLYRVGTCAPCTHQTLPFDCRGSLLEGGTWVGLVLLLP